jgi:hypothetical protein
MNWGRTSHIFDSSAILDNIENIIDGDKVSRSSRNLYVGVNARKWSGQLDSLWIHPLWICHDMGDMLLLSESTVTMFTQFG